MKEIWEDSGVTSKWRVGFLEGKSATSTTTTLFTSLSGERERESLAAKLIVGNFFNYVLFCFVTFLRIYHLLVLPRNDKSKTKIDLLILKETKNLI